MGGVCEVCVQDTNHEYSLFKPVTVPESLKPTIFPAKGSPIESEFSSVNVLSLPSISPNSSFILISNPNPQIELELNPLSQLN